MAAVSSARLPSHAVFVDGDWLLAGTRQGHIPLDHAQLMAFFERSFGADLAVRMYLSAPADSPATKRLGETLARLGIALHAGAADRRGRSDIDMRLALDAMALPAEASTFTLVSGDSDFVPLLQRMRAAGRRTVLVSFPLMLSTALREAADEFVNLETAVHAGIGAAARRVVTLPAAPAPPRPPDRSASRRSGPRLPSQVLIDKGEFVKPYLLIRKLLVAARRDVSIIDTYVGAELFELLACLPAQIGVTMISTERHAPPDLAALVGRCRKEGRSLRVYSSKDFHDRYLRVDDAWWHSGHSFKDLGSKISQLTRETASNCAALRRIEARTIAAADELCKPGG